MKIFARLQLEENKKLPDVFPELRIVLNGKTLGKITIDSPVWKSYSVTISTTPSPPALIVEYEKAQQTKNLKIVIDKMKFL